MNDMNEIDVLDAAVFSGDMLEDPALRQELAEHIARWQRALASRWEDADGVSSPPKELAKAVFVLAFTGEGAAAQLCYGWEDLVTTVEDMVGGDEAWHAILAGLDEWVRDEDGIPFYYSCRFEITNMCIYRLYGDPA